MRWTFRIGLLCLILLMVYTAWPFVDLYRLGRAIERRDVAAVSARIDLRALRPALSRQVLATYLRLSGREAKLGGFARDVAVGIGASFANRALEDVITPQRVLELLTEGLSAVGEPGGGTRPFAFAPSSLGGFWDLYVTSEYKLQNFYVSVPPGLPPAQRVRLRLRLMQWTWKLYEIELPEAVISRLVEQLIQQTERR